MNSFDINFKKKILIYMSFCLLVMILNITVTVAFTIAWTLILLTICPSVCICVAWIDIYVSVMYAYCARAQAHNQPASMDHVWLSSYI